jgi:hypothetical protein
MAIDDRSRPRTFNDDNDAMTQPADIEVLYFDGCPSVDQLLPRLRAIVAQHGDDPDAIRLLAVETPDAARAERFLGSPSLRVDGRDVDPTAAARDDYGLKCRIYRSEHGQTTIPPDDWITAALTRR